MRRVDYYNPTSSWNMEDVRLKYPRVERVIKQAVERGYVSKPATVSRVLRRHGIEHSWGMTIMWEMIEDGKLSLTNDWSLEKGERFYERDQTAN